MKVIEERTDKPKFFHLDEGAIAYVVVKNIGGTVQDGSDFYLYRESGQTYHLLTATPDGILVYSTYLLQTISYADWCKQHIMKMCRITLNLKREE